MHRTPRALAAVALAVGLTVTGCGSSHHRRCAGGLPAIVEPVEPVPVEPVEPVEPAPVRPAAPVYVPPAVVPHDDQSSSSAPAPC